MPNNQQQGIPTADQEALQSPRIDPVFLLAGGLTGGLDAGIGQYLRNISLRSAIPDVSQELTSAFGNDPELMAAFKNLATPMEASVNSSGISSPYLSGLQHFLRTVLSGAAIQGLTGSKIGSLPIGQNGPIAAFANHPVLQNILDNARTEIANKTNIPEW